MNVPVVWLVPVVAALGIGGGWYYRTSEAESARLHAALQEAQRQAQDRTAERDRARTEAARHAKARDEARAQLAAAVADAAARTRALDEARAETARLTADLATEREASAARESAHRARADALAEAVQRTVRIRALVNDGVHRAAQAVTAAQDTLYREPTPEAFSAFREALIGAGAAIASARTAIAELAAFAEDRAVILAENAADLDALRRPFERTAAFLDAWSARVAATLDSCRAQTLTVRADREWQSSDLWVETGECVAFYSTGEWRSDGDHAITARGEEPQAANGGPAPRIAGEFAHGALLGRVRGSDLVHHAVAPIKADSLGRFEFRINDAAYTDNRGALEVFVWAWKPITLE